MDLTGEIAINIIIVVINTPLISMDRSCRQNQSGNIDFKQHVKKDRLNRYL